MSYRCSVYSQVTDIWYDHLGKIVHQRTKAPATPKGVVLAAEIAEDEEDGLGELTGCCSIVFVGRTGNHCIHPN